MIKIVIISDTHGSYQPLLDIQTKEYDADYYFHLGDFCIPDYLVSPFLAVKGNNDFSTEFQKKKDLVIDEIKIHLEHGDNLEFQVNKANYIKKIDPDIFIFGHTHRFYVGTINDKTILINPGSLTQHRDDFYGSYAILLIDDNKKISVEKRQYPFKEDKK